MIPENWINPIQVGNEELDLENSRWYAVYRCNCGKIFGARVDSIESGSTKSCGCLQIITTIKHGYSNTLLYHVWDTMIQRCDNENNEKCVISNNDN